jgi:hypothetical protein
VTDALYLVYFLPGGTGDEEKARHPAWQTTTDDLLEEYRDRGDRVIQVRYLEPPDEVGVVDYQDQNYVG